MVGDVPPAGTVTDHVWVQRVHADRPSPLLPPTTSEVAMSDVLRHSSGLVEGGDLLDVIPGAKIGHRIGVWLALARLHDRHELVEVVLVTTGY